MTRDVGGDGPPTMDAEHLGGALADALLCSDVGAAYEQATNRAAANGRGVRLTLSLAETPALLSVPWEFLYRRPRFLASQRRTPLVRLLETGSLVPPPTIDAKVRMLAVVASPSDLPPLDVESERRRIEQVVAGMAAAERVELDWLDPATPRALRHALRDGNYHVLHYVGHSAFTANGDGMLYLEQDADGRSVGVDSTLFANLLSDQDRLRLVVLNSCEGARTTLTDPYAGVATTLIQLGVPAVVAMQFEISDDAALLFAEELYTNLVGRQDPIDAAVAEARKAVYTEIDAIEWATPVLFVRDPDVELFRFEVPAAPLPPPPPTGLRREEVAPVGAPDHEVRRLDARSPAADAVGARRARRPRRGRGRVPRRAQHGRRRQPAADDDTTGRVPDRRPRRRGRRSRGGAAPAERARHRRRGDRVLRRRDQGRDQDVRGQLPRRSRRRDPRSR